MEQNQDTTINFSLVGISTEQYALIPESYREGEEVGFNVELKYATSMEDKVVVVFTKCHFMHQEIPFLIIEIANHFKIHPANYASMVNDAAKTITIPANFAAHLVLLTIGTTRGALHSKVENTVFNKFLIPTINLTELVTEPVVINY